MRIGCLQFAPQVGDIDNNLNRADAVLSKANTEDLDLLVLPELAFTGYNFNSLQEISPFLEPKGSGISALWARTVALKLNCVVTVGYPEKVDVKPKWPTSPEYYNSVIVVNDDGETIGNYRKRFLYYTDETWALEGQEGFYNGFIPGLGTTAMGICMDLNPYKFEAPWHAFEFAFHCLEVEANLVIVTMAWLTREEASLFSRMPNEPDMDSLTYWVTRLEPLIRAESQDEIIIVFCNRTGIEGDAVYAGTSAVVGVKDGEVSVYGMLGRGDKDLLVVDTDAAPYAKLVYRPDNQGTTVGSVVESPSGLKEPEQKDSDRGTSTNPLQALSSLKPSSKGTTAYGVAQHQTQLEEARQISQPHSPASQKSHSSHRSHASMKSHSSHQSRSSQKSQSSQLSQSSRGSYASKKSPSVQKGTPTLGVTDDYHYVPLGLTKTGSDRSTISVQGSVSSKTSSTSARSKGSSRLRSSRDVGVSQCRTYQLEATRKEKPRSPLIQIPSLSTEIDTIPTPSGPNPTPLAIRPKLIIPQDAHRRPAKPHVPTPHPSMGGRSSRAYDGQVSIQQQKEILTPTTAFDEMTPNSPNRFFWIPSDTLLKTPMEPRTWTPARADSPTLSMKVPETSQAYTKNTAARSQPVEYQSIGRASPAQLRSISKSRAESKSSGQPIEPQAITRCAFEPSESSLTPAKNVTHTKSTDRSDSPFADRPDWAAIAQRLDALSSRPESAAVNKTDSFSPRPGSNLARRVEGNDKSPNAMPSRPSSPKSRNASRSRAANPVSVDDPLGDQRQESISRASIRIGANANVLDNKPARGPSAMCRPNSRMTNVEPSHRPMSKPRHSRSNSVSVGYVAHTTDLEDGNGGRPPSRAASRGRQRAPKPNDGIEAQHERSDSPRVNPRDCSVPVRRPSAPSFRFRSPAEFEAEMKRISPECSVQAYYGDTGNGDENEIIGEIIVRRSPSCAVHGRKTQATSPRGNDSKTPESTSSRRVDGYRQNATPLKATEVEDTNASLIKTGDGVDSSIHSPTDGTQPSPANFTPSVETPESSKGSPTTPQSISHPKAPKVMVPIGESNRRIPPTSPSAPFVAPLKATELTIAGAVNDVIIRPQSALW